MSITTSFSPSAACICMTDGTSPSTQCIDDAAQGSHRLPRHAAAAEGQSPEDWEDREQTLFRAEVGDDIDRALIKSDGSYTYFAADVAYFRDKYRARLQ
jgi:arginyl-tRNA synthetase